MNAAEGAITDRGECVGAHFRVFADGHGHWCADKDDGTVGGIFSNREVAIRFARRESLFDDAGATGVSSHKGAP